MTVQERMGCRGPVPIALALLLGGVVTAAAQTLSVPAFTNGSDADEVVAGTPTTASRERETSGALLSSAPASFLSRFAALATVDADGSSGAGVEALAVDYDIDFTATAPGAYRLTVETTLRGDLHLVNDGANGASADVSAVSGFQAGGTIIAGGLGLSDPGIVSGSSGAVSGIDESNSATIFGVSNGAPVAHTLSFQWTNITSTNAMPGDEAAVRLGGTSDIATETAGDYPGSPARVQADDGHFVTVTIESLCGNGVPDAGPSYAEDCDEGVANGGPASCCAADCSFKADGSSCDDGDTCTLGDECTAGVCEATSQQVCPLCQTCDPVDGCQIGPRTACKLGTLPRKSSLQLKDKTPGVPENGDKVTFKWSKGEATEKTDFGDPVTDDDFALCLFDSLGGLIFKSTAPAGGVCINKPCWKELGVKGFRYKDAARTPAGADKVLLKAGLAGKAKAQFKGKGPDLDAFGLPFPLPVTAQLQSENGQCWEATFSAANASTNTEQQFKGKAD